MITTTTRTVPKTKPVRRGNSDDEDDGLEERGGRGSPGRSPAAWRSRWRNVIAVATRPRRDAGEQIAGSWRSGSLATTTDERPRGWPWLWSPAAVVVRA